MVYIATVNIRFGFGFGVGFCSRFLHILHATRPIIAKMTTVITDTEGISVVVVFGSSGLVWKASPENRSNVLVYVVVQP
jgi:hypothetical protein